MPKATALIGTYQLISKLGAGAFGEVWLATNTAAPQARPVAIKIPLDEDIDLDALLQEATAWARATGHPNVLEFIAARIFNGQPVLISEYVEGGSLYAWLKKHGGKAPTVNEAVKLTQEVLDGLAYLHGRKLIHRDLKPANILMGGTTPRIADFGLSRVLKSTNSSRGFGGTIAYSAPEAFRGERNEQTDVWSVGVILYQLLTGRLPFPGNDQTEVMGAIFYTEPPSLPASIPVWVREAVMKALAKDVQLRFKTAAEMRAALNAPRVMSQPTPSPQHKMIEPTVVVDLITIPRFKPPAKPAQDSTSVCTFDFVMVRVDEQGYIIERANAQVAGFEEDLGPEARLQMVKIPAGVFHMGSTDAEVEAAFADARRYDKEAKREQPRHRVAVSAFWMSRYPVTQAQWRAVARLPNVKIELLSEPSSFVGDHLPVERVSWEEAVEFCQRLERQSKNTYRLPSEAEWEYACRAGSTTPFAFGATITPELANYDGNYSYGNAAKGEYRRQTVPVGSLGVANSFGLYDMHGNVREWCADTLQANYKDAPIDGSAWLSGGNSNYRVLRGGSWLDSGWFCRCANRTRTAPGNCDFLSGFRLVLSSRTP